MTFRSKNGRSGMIGRTWNCLRGMLAMISCPGGSEGDICMQLCIYVFGDVWIVVYDMGECHMDMVIDSEGVD